MSMINPGEPHASTSTASLLRRFAAIAYDSILIVAVLGIGSAPVIVLHGDAITSNIIFQIYLLAIWFSFYAWFWTHGGQTLGMKAWKISVCQTDGSSIQLRHAAIRFFSAALGLANMSMLIHPKKLGWHEQLSRTQTLRQ